VPVQQLLIVCLLLGGTPLLAACGSASTLREPQAPVITLDPANGGGDTQVMLAGTGFPRRETMTIHVASSDSALNSIIVSSEQVDAQGAFTTAFIMPTEWPSGSAITERDLVVVAKTTDGTIQASAPFTFQATGTVAPGAGSWRPLDVNACEMVRGDLAALLEAEVTRVEGPVPFYDTASGQSGDSCQLYAGGTGETFPGFVQVAAQVGDLFRGQGWAEAPQYLADGPTGMVQGFTLDQQLVIVRVEWTPSNDATCPANQPLSACAESLAPAQMIYRITIDLVQA
jgi:hypothetical protein